MIREILDHIDFIFNSKLLLIHVSFDTLFDSTSCLARFAMKIIYLPVRSTLCTDTLIDVPCVFRVAAPLYKTRFEEAGKNGAQRNACKYATLGVNIRLLAKHCKR